MDRDRDRRPFPREDQYGDGRGQSYRPPRSPPPRSDTYRAPRSPLRGSSYVDSYRAPPRGRTRSPLGFRRRSRSPPPFRPRDGGDSYRGRARSPPRRDFMREGSYRPPPSRVYRDDPTYGARSPMRALRDRSPLPLKRGRDISPVGSRGRRSPPPAKRERLDSPPRSRYNAYPPPSGDPSPGRPRREMRLTPPRGVTRSYRLLSRSPLQHNENVNPRKIDNWRRRSPSPPKLPKTDLISTDNSGAPSVTSSRRSSPPIHPSRLAAIEPDERPPRKDDHLPSRPTYRPASPATVVRPRSPVPVRPRSPLPARPRSPLPARPRSPLPARPRSPLLARPRSPVVARPRSPVAAPARSRSPPRKREPSLPIRDNIPTGPSRAPPTGPARHEEPLSMRAPPTGPGGSRSYAQIGTDVHIPTGPRPRATSPPSHPRGGPPISRGGFQRDYPPRDYPPRGDFQGSWGRGGSYGGSSYRGGRGGAMAAAPVSSYGRDADYTAAPPSGPRGSFGAHPPPPLFRGGANSTSSTYPRTTRFGPSGAPLPSGPKADVVSGGGKPFNAYLSDLPRIVEGGVKAPELYDRGRLDKLEDEAEKLRRVIDDKQARKRKGLREWAKLTRDSETAGFRAGLADDNVRALAGESDGGAAF